MTLPEASVHDGDKTPRAAFCRLNTMQQRADFLRAARAARQSTKTMLVQARHRDDGTDHVRVGYTCSKKVGNAVARNRAKRRLKHIAAEILPQFCYGGWDYVLIGRAEHTGGAAFDDLRRDLIFALKRLHRK